MNQLVPFPFYARRRTRKRASHRGLIFAAVYLLLVPIAVGPAMVSVLRPTESFAAARAAVDQRVQDATPEFPASRQLDLGLPQSAVIRARDGTVLAEIHDSNYGRRTSVPLHEISDSMVQATVAAEDRRFFEHHGVDVQGLARAIAQNARAEDVSSGASTIDMQLVRNLYLTDERTEQTLSRKVREAIAAMQLDREFSKPEIVEAYLNVVYYGEQAHGVEAASQTYFGKHARDLTLSESSLLAGLPQSPTVLDPFRNLEGARERQRYVLDQMVISGMITADDADEAWETPPELVPRSAPEELAPHWANYVQDYVREHLGTDALYLDGLDITTTIDPEIQRIAEQIVTANENTRRQVRANNTAMVVLDRQTSQVLAMVGSKDFNNTAIDGQVNVALAGRQPGSSIKPLLYLTGFEKGLNPAVQVTDAITEFSAPPGQPSYVPKNYEDKYYGLVTLRDALGNSLNVPAVKVLKFVGVPALLDMARRLGVTTLDNWDPRWLSLTLGGGEVRLLELTGAYATIARLGEYHPIEPLLSATNARGAKVYETGATPGAQVVDPRITYQLLNIMGDSGARKVTFGDASPLNLKRPHMVKTGTTDDFRDTWTVGCLPQICVGVWMGNTQNGPMIHASSSLTAGKVWVDMMNALIQRYQWAPDPFPMPDGLIKKTIPNASGARPGVKDYEEVFLPGNDKPFRLEMNWKQPDP